MYYAVPNIKLIPQDMKMSCWYASAQMIIQYSREKEQQTRMAVVDAGSVGLLGTGIGNFVGGLSGLIGGMQQGGLSPACQAIMDRANASSAVLHEASERWKDYNARHPEGCADQEG